MVTNKSDTHNPANIDWYLQTKATHTTLQDLLTYDVISL